MIQERSNMLPLSAPLLALSFVLCAGVTVPATAGALGDTSQRAAQAEVVRQVVRELSQAAKRLTQERQSSMAKATSVEPDTAAFWVGLVGGADQPHLGAGLVAARSRANRPPPISA
ncbi:MAG: hypothetical protein AAF797_14250 [Planctomycetota bacterium]